MPETATKQIPLFQDCDPLSVDWPQVIIAPLADLKEMKETYSADKISYVDDKRLKDVYPLPNGDLHYPSVCVGGAGGRHSVSASMNLLLEGHHDLGPRPEWMTQYDGRGMYWGWHVRHRSDLYTMTFSVKVRISDRCYPFENPCSPWAHDRIVRSYRRSWSITQNIDRRDSVKTLYVAPSSVRL